MNERTQLTVDEQIRIESLKLAIMNNPGQSITSQIEMADAIRDWILLGDLPPAPDGVIY